LEDHAASIFTLSWIIIVSETWSPNLCQVSCTLFIRTHNSFYHIDYCAWKVLINPGMFVSSETKTKTSALHFRFFFWHFWSIVESNYYTLSLYCYAV